MSEENNRRVVKAKRRINENVSIPRNIYVPDNNSRRDDENNLTQGIKRSFNTISSTPSKKNIASDRLKRLRTELAEQAISSPKATTPKVTSPLVNNCSDGLKGLKSELAGQAFSPPKSLVNKATDRLKGLAERIFSRPKSAPKAASPLLHNKDKSKRHQNSHHSPLIINGKRQLDSDKVEEPKKCSRTICGDVKSEKNIRSDSCTVSQNDSYQSIILQASVLSSTSSNCEQMEWSDEDNIGSVSDKIHTSFEADINNLNLHNIPSLNTPEVTSTTNIYIVVDTNIFLSQLDIVEQVMSLKCEGQSVPIIFVPWIVIEELDYFKEDKVSKCKWNAQKAIKFINGALEKRSGRMRGQTLDEVNQQRTLGKNPDDKIVACCLQVVEKHGNMILLSNDVNLKNKALINNIPACSHSEIITKITVKTSNGSKDRQVIDKMVNLCWKVIRTCAQKAYGNNWNKLYLLDKSPTSFNECANIFKKYWMSVFEEHLMKHFKNAMDGLSSYMTKHPNFTDNPGELNQLIVLCVRVCIFFKDIAECKTLVENTIRDLNNIRDA